MTLLTPLIIILSLQLKLKYTHTKQSNNQIKTIKSKQYLSQIKELDMFEKDLFELVKASNLEIEMINSKSR